jgi:LysR family transcriptional regulator, glycine cleavage system transcriptional activator
VYMSKFRIPALNSLRAFEAAARYQSIKKACDELHVSHAAISRHILKVEQRVGRDLFERHPRKIALTADGEALLGAVTTAFSIIQRAIAQLSGNQSPERLVISVDPDFAGLWLVPKLADFYTIAPNALVEILAEKGTPASFDPRADCAIHYTEAGLQIENGEVLFRSSLFPVYAPNLLQGPPLRTPEDLRHHALLHDRSRTEWQECVQRYGIAAEVDVRCGSVFSETTYCLDAAVRGQGVAMGDDFLAGLYLSEGRLVRPFDYLLPSKNAYYFVAPHGTAKHPLLKVFRKWLFENIDRLRNGSGAVCRENS